MGFQFPSGRFVLARVNNAAINTVTELSWEDMESNAVTLAAGDRLIIKTIVFANSGTAKRVDFFQDHDGDNALDAGEQVVTIESAGQGTEVVDLGNGLPLDQINTATDNGFHVVASAVGAVSITVIAELVFT